MEAPGSPSRRFDFNASALNQGRRAITTPGSFSSSSTYSPNQYTVRRADTISDQAMKPRFVVWSVSPSGVNSTATPLTTNRSFVDQARSRIGPSHRIVALGVIPRFAQSATAPSMRITRLDNRLLSRPIRFTASGAMLSRFADFTSAAVVLGASPANEGGWRAHRGCDRLWCATNGW